MRLEILRNLAAPFPDFREGDVRDVEDELADSLVKRGLAANTDKELSDIDKKTGQRKGVEVTPRLTPPDTDAPGGGTSAQATQPADEGESAGGKAAAASRRHR
jgi:hypothetical protein